MRIEIIPAEVRHVGLLVRDLRAMDRCEAIAFGYDNVHRGIRRGLKMSFYARTAFVDGKIAAMWGVEGSLLGEASPWLMTTPAVERVPVAMLKTAAREMRAMASGATLTGLVMARYTKAVRFLKLLGFSLGDAVPGPTGEPFLPYSWGPL